MFCDSAEPDRIITLRRAGFRAVGCVKGKGSVQAQIDWLKQRKIYIDSSCINTKKEIDQYRWRKCPTTGEYIDEPVNIFDDAMAALRYGVQRWRLQGEVEERKAKPEYNWLEEAKNQAFKAQKTKKRSYY